MSEFYVLLVITSILLVLLYHYFTSYKCKCDEVEEILKLWDTYEAGYNRKIRILERLNGVREANALDAENSLPKI